MATSDTPEKAVISCLSENGWRITNQSCVVPFPMIEGYEDKAGATAFIAESAGRQVVIVVKRVAQAADYPAIIREIIERHASIKPAAGEIETEVVIDESVGHFSLQRSGWANGYRIHGAIIHVDIRGDKIWIQHDGTGAGVANDLVAAGVPKDKIVLAFKSPELRKYTDFAVA
jgi:XisI protein